MIASGEKLEEYREDKAYWRKRLFYPNGKKKHYDIVRFRNGYQSYSPFVDVEFKGIGFGDGKAKWGGGYQRCIIIRLGKIIRTRDILNCLS